MPGWELAELHLHPSLCDQYCLAFLLLRTQHFCSKNGSTAWPSCHVLRLWAWNVTYYSFFCLPHRQVGYDTCWGPVPSSGIAGTEQKVVCYVTAVKTKHSPFGFMLQHTQLLSQSACGSCAYLSAISRWSQTPLTDYFESVTGTSVAELSVVPLSSQGGWPTALFSVLCLNRPETDASLSPEAGYNTLNLKDFPVHQPT